ncbi:MAG: AEC family transporter [Pseudomonadota bacterium]
MDLALAILPIFLMFAAGYGLVATGILPKENWPAIELFSFRVLVPIVLIEALYSADLSPSNIGPLALAMFFTFVAVSCTVLSFRLFMSKDRLTNPRFTTVFQTSTRWNAFIAFAAADQIGGPPALALIAVGVAVLIPLINVVNISVLATFGPTTRTARDVVKAVVKNPLVIGCAIGIFLNVTGLYVPEPVRAAMSAIGDGALGIGLLVVGAGVKLRRLFASTPALWVSVFVRLVVSPAILFGCAWFLGLSPLETFTGALVMSVPAATNGYIVARQMGGDSELYADVLMWQTALSILMIPVLAALVL